MCQRHGGGYFCLVDLIGAYLKDFGGDRGARMNLKLAQISIVPKMPESQQRRKTRMKDKQGMLVSEGWSVGLKG